MPFYIEALLWYLLLLDSIIYNVLAWGKGKWHHASSHWVSDYIPLEKSIGILYLVLTLWLGYALYRMQLILFI